MADSIKYYAWYECLSLRKISFVQKFRDPETLHYA